MYNQTINPILRRKRTTKNNNPISRQDKKFVYAHTKARGSNVPTVSCCCCCCCCCCCVVVVVVFPPEEAVKQHEKEAK